MFKLNYSLKWALFSAPPKSTGSPEIWSRLAKVDFSFKNDGHCWQTGLIFISQKQRMPGSQEGYVIPEVFALNYHHIDPELTSYRPWFIIILIIVLLLIVMWKPISPPGLLALVQPVTSNFSFKPNLNPKSSYHLTDTFWQIAFDKICCNSVHRPQNVCPNGMSNLWYVIIFVDIRIIFLHNFMLKGQNTLIESFIVCTFVNY